MVGGDDVEEINRDRLLRLVAGQLVAAGRPDDLRNVGVGVISTRVAVGGVDV